jgi:hypothetical protein
MNKKALGRYEELGSLFDARTDDFIGAKLFNKRVDKNASYYSTIKSTPSKYEYINKESYENKFSKLNIDGELKVSILLDMITLGGSGKYLKSNKDAQKSNKFTIISNNQTRIEKINFYDDQINDLVSDKALNNTNATHVVTGIIWGANIIVSIEYDNAEKQDNKEINGNFNAYCDKIKGVLSLGGKVGADFNEGLKISEKNLKINIDCDIEITEPTSIKEALNLIKSFKENIAKTNDGDGIPLEYILQPINKQVFPALEGIRYILFLDESTINYIQNIFEKLLQKKQTLKDNLNDLEIYNSYIPTKLVEKFQDKETILNRLEINFKDSFKKILIDVRSGNQNLSIIEKFLQENNNILKEIEQFCSDFSNLKKKFRFEEIDRFKLNNINYLSRDEELKDLELKHLKHDVYIFYSFSADKFSECRKRNFISFFNLRETKPNDFFYVINTDIHYSIEAFISSPRIYHYSKGELITDDYLVYKGNQQSFQILATCKSVLEKNNSEKIILLGKRGTGKKNIFDKVLNNYLYKILRTRLFEIIDTGKGPVEDKESFINVKTIFIILKFENRFEFILNRYLEEIRNIENFKNKIAIIITHSDYSDNPNKDFTEICEIFQDHCQNIIFYSKYSDSSQMANIMFSFISII